MATIRSARRKDGTPYWRAVWFITDAKGKRRQQTKSFGRRGDAKAHAARMEVEVEKRGVGDPEKHSFGRFTKRWIKTLEMRGEHQPGTLDGYERNLGLAAHHIGHVLLGKLTAEHLDDCYSTLLASGGKSKKPNADGTRDPRPLSARTVLHVHRAIHTCLEQARKWKLVGENVARDARSPTPNKSKARALSADETARVLRAAFKAEASGNAYPGIDAVVMVLLATGLRRSELLGLAFDAIDLDAGNVEICRTVVYDRSRTPFLRENKAKTDRSLRSISLPASVIERLRRHKVFILEQKLQWGRDYAPGPLLVFPGPGGIPFDPMATTLRLRQIMRQAGVKGAQPTHGHRHTMATTLFRLGTDLKTVSTRLGHSTTAITVDLYIHEEVERDQAAADVMGSVIQSATKVQQETEKNGENRRETT